MKGLDSNETKRLGKRIAACFLCLAMVLTTISLPAFTTEVNAADLPISSVDINVTERLMHRLLHRHIPERQSVLMLAI